MKYVTGCFAAVGGCAVLVVGFVVFVAFIGALGSTGGKGTGSAKATTAHPPKRVTDSSAVDLVLKPGWKGEETGYGSYKIRGVVVNKSGRRLSYAQIQFNAYDKSGAQVDTAMTNTTNLEAGARWRFEALGLRAENVKTLKLAELSGW